MAKRVLIVKRRPSRPGSRLVSDLKRVYLAVSDSADGEGVYAVNGPNGEQLPLLAIDKRGLVSLKRFAQQLANSHRRTVRIICFTERSHHETFSPSTTGDKGS